jgi:organic radical activating enzyme
MSKFFPIKTETACLAKWSYSKVVLHYGLTSSCHRVNNHTFDIDTFDFHNTSEKIAQRETMLQGQWPDDEVSDEYSTTCKKYCGALEATGEGSDRHFFNDLPELYPDELDKDPTLTNVGPTILELYINNTCNLSCIYCIPEFSSKIHTEMIKFGRFEKNGLVLESKHKQVSNYEKIQTNFWKWLDENAIHLKRLQLLGGEPMYQKEFDSFIKFFDQNPCPTLELQITTNLMLNMKKFKNYIDQIKALVSKKKLKRLDIVCSIDCWGPQQEYVRSGLNLETWEENFNYLLAQKWITLHIHSVVSALTIKTLPELLKKIKQWQKQKNITLNFNKLTYPPHMSLENFDSKEFIDDFNSIAELIDYREVKAIKLISEKSCFNKEEVLKLITYLDELDRRRGTNWTKIFPWLERYRDVV